jgi:hypothetical protein
MFNIQINQRLDIARPAWLFAKTCRFLDEAGLVVYKSPMLRETSVLYDEVRDFLERFEVRVHRKGMFIDADMMLGKGELTVYLTSAHAHPDDDDLSSIEWLLTDQAEMN